MKLWKKTVLAPFAFAAVAISAQAIADPISHTVQLTATVPTADFNVGPTDPSWIGTPQALSYNTATDAISSLSKGFTYKNTNGAINAILDAEPVITASNNSIKLKVSFNDIAINETTATEVVAATQAATGGSASLKIEPEKPSGGYIPGAYTGSVQISFDAVI